MNNTNRTIQLPKFTKIVASAFFISINFLVSFGQGNETETEPEAELIGCEVDVCYFEDHETEYSGYFQSNFTKDPNLLLNDENVGKGFDLTRIMQSNFAGLSVSANAFTPGASSRISMRGYRSFHGENQPLILLNGMPIDNSEWNNTFAGTDKSNRLLDIDPNLIKSIEVIKSAAGRAQYGIKGANGVIHIKTKSAFERKPTISFSSSLGFESITNKIDLQNTYAQGIDGRYLGPETERFYSWGPKIEDLYFDGNTNYAYDKNGQLGEVGIKPAQAYDPYEFFENGIHRNLSLEFAGGTSKFNYLVTASNLKEKGIIPKNEFGRNNLSAILGLKVSKKLTLQLNALLSRAEADRSQRGANLSGVPVGVLRTAPTFDNSNGFSNAADNPEAYQLMDGTQRSYNQGYYNNPYWSVNKNKHNDIVNRQILKLSGEYNLKHNLDLLFNFGLDHFKDFRKGGLDINFVPSASGIDRTGTAYDRNLEFGAQSSDISLRYKLSKSDLLEVTSTVGLNYYQSNSSFQLKEGTGLRSSDNVSTSNVNQLTNLSQTNILKRTGVVLSTDAKLKDYLTINGSLRIDDSNKFGSMAKGFVSYGFGVGLSLMDLFSSNDNRVFNVDLIASTGKFGNEVNLAAIPRYIPSEITGDYLSFFADPTQNFEPNLVSVSEFIGAESTRAYDVGIDISLFKEKVGLKVVYYSELSFSLIQEKRVSTTTGLNGLFENAGAMSNKGVDISLALNLIKKQNFNWSSDIKFNSYNNLVTKHLGPGNSLDISDYWAISPVVEEGYPYSSIKGPGFKRNEDGILLINSAGWPQTDFNRVVLGSAIPDWVMYINNSFQIGENFNLFASIDISQGGDRWCGTCGFLDLLGRTQLSADEYDQSVVFEGVKEDGTVNDIQVDLVSENTFNNYRFEIRNIAEPNVFDASWVRLRKISMSYNLSSIIEIKELSKLSLGFYGENLIIRTKYPSFDPETNLKGSSDGFGLEYFNNPGTKSYGLSIKATY